MTSSPPPIDQYPPHDSPYGQPSPDDAHVRTLAVCHFVLAGLSAVGCCGYGVFSIVMASFVRKAITTMPLPPAMGSGAPATAPLPGEFGEFFGTLHTVLGVVYIVVGFLYGTLHFLAGRSLLARRHMTFTYVVAGIACINLPLGTVLGVFTFIVLSRPSVQAQFAARLRADEHGVRD